MDRLTRLRAALEEERLDAILITGPVDDVYGRHSQNRFFVSGFTGSAGVVLVTRDKALLAVDFRYVEQAERESVPRGFALWETGSRRLKGYFAEFVKEAGLGGKRIGVSAADCTLRDMETMQRAALDLPWGLRPQLGPASPLIEKLRRVKDGEELAGLQRAIDIADAAYDRVAPAIVPGQTELQVAAAIEAAIKDLGGQGVSFDTIVASGPAAAMPHASPTAAAIREGETIVIDMGALAGGYCSDLTRTTVLGQSDAKFQEVYEVVFAAQQRAIEKVEPGMTGVAAHELAESVIREAGYGERFGHGLGHGVGLDVHEAPYLGRTSEDVLEEGMVFTIEPGIYIPGWGGIRIEDVVVLENGRARVLSHAKKLTPNRSPSP
ncbi:MAG: aminopeptidase P family protein [Dehalococcoidia bacterium]